MKARFAHINVIARDWRRLAGFYQTVFGCVPIPPERDLSGPALDAATGLTAARIRGMHLRLPGGDDRGPTLEMFEYSPPGPDVEAAVHGRGFGHIAFQVDDVDAGRREVLAAGGREMGERVSLVVPGAGTVTFVYVADPEGNIIELQSWIRTGE